MKPQDPWLGVAEYCMKFGFNTMKTVNLLGKTPKQIETALAYQPGVQKVALYAVVDTKKEKLISFQHGAIQVPGGKWHSKMGSSYLIEHETAQDLVKSTSEYVIVGVLMRDNPAFKEKPPKE